MKNPDHLLRQHSPEEKKARQAILHIQTWMDRNYPRLAFSARTRMILECLIEVTEERKRISPQA